MMQTGKLPGPRRVVIDRVDPQVDGGAFAVKRVTGEPVAVRAIILCDGHDLLRAVVRYRKQGARTWRETALEDSGNDIWVGTFVPEEPGNWEYTVAAWVDHLLTWCEGLEKKAAAGVVEEIDLLVGASLLEHRGARAGKRHAPSLEDAARLLRDTSIPLAKRITAALSRELASHAHSSPDLSLAAQLPAPLPLQVDRPLAGCSAWYELFPRSITATQGDAVRHGTLQDAVERLPYVARMGFDILYLPPIHPIGSTARKGKNNAVVAEAGDPGSPWAIGAADGGHTAIHRELGTLTDLHQLIEAARELRMEIALDIAFQCSPDHPWVAEHPDWFVQRPDGSIQYAENPPKKYQDIYPLNFESPSWKSLWEELRDVFLYWVDQGVRVFRVDNPHTKSFHFWDWVIAEVRARDPGVIFLAEAFTRPWRMYRLAKGGFTQSYTYFTWRNTPEEMREYLTELTHGEPREYFRPNFWPNTPDILHEDLQTGGRAAFVARLILAATLGANYGIYGPAFELQESTAVRAGSEEYLNSEKYEVRHWDLDQTFSLASLIATVNGIRRTNPALQSNRHLQFHAVDNREFLCYSKRSDDGANVILVCVTMDYHNGHSGWVEFSPAAVGLEQRLPFTVKDLLTGISYTWTDTWNYIALRPADTVAHIFLLEAPQ